MVKMLCFLFYLHIYMKIKYFTQCKNNGIKLFYFTEEKRYDLSNYIDKVYTKFEELCEKIDEALLETH